MSGGPRRSPTDGLIELEFGNGRRVEPGVVNESIDFGILDGPRIRGVPGIIRPDAHDRVIPA